MTAINPQLREVLTCLAVIFPGEYEAALRDAQMLEQAAASAANPYGSYAGKHGEFTAASPAEVAEGVDDDRCRHCGEPIRPIMGSKTLYVHAQDGIRPCRWGKSPNTFAEPYILVPTGHLPQHTGTEPGCTYPGCTIHQPAPTAVADAAELAAHAPREAQ